jgi:hypothetical protein
MSNKRHKGRTRTFEGLTFSEQATSINASIVYLKKAIEHLSFLRDVKGFC